MPALVCVPITVRTPEGAVAESIAAAEHGADLVELRVDGFFGGDDPEGFAAVISSLVGRSPLPCIVTCRSNAEGGEYEGDDESLATLYARIAAAPDPDQVPRYLDIEHARFIRSALYRKTVRDIVAGAAASGQGKPSIILSFHDFSGRPADLFRKLTAMREHPEAAILKVAFKARSLRDAIEALHLPASSDRPMISLAMGEFGLMSRVLAPKFGGMLTFASLRPASVTAPGQPTIGDLLRLFRFRSVSPKTALYGVIGWPVSHS
ncbi:MAG: type I 3-dehydroquinate dehydratase, partial [Phycisphaerales bacterium]